MTYNRLSNDWEWKALKDVIIFNPEEELQKGMAVKQINLDKLVPYHKFINEFEEVEYSGKGRKFRNGDVLVPQISSALLGGKTAFVNNLAEEEVGVGSNWFTVLRAVNQVTNPDFLYYLATTARFRELAIQSLEGSTNSQYINLENFKESAFAFPTYNEQCIIADTLSTLDAKIQKNSEVCQTLEKILSHLFHDWFIMYNFPDEHGNPFREAGGELLPSELGFIPKGWKTGFLSDIGRIVGGATPPKQIEAYYTSNGISWITPKDLSKFRLKFISKGTIDITEQGLNNSGASLLPRGTVLFSSRAPIGYIAIAKNELATNQGFRSIIPYSGIGSTYVYYLLLHKTKEITNIASGTTFKEISGQTLKKLRVAIPSASVLQAFKEQTDCLMQYQENLEKENQLLTSIREKLLPMLMSGIIRIPMRR